MAKNEQGTMEKIVSLCKRRGFVFPSSEIYGGFAAVYDYGPLGVELSNNIKKAWWKTMVHEREDVVGLDSAIFMSPKVWEASGHVNGFSDPLTECKKCNVRHRVDHMLESIDVFADEKMSVEEISALFEENKDKLKCPKCGAQEFTEIRNFNLLVQSNLGNFTGDWAENPVYLRGETCQGIYVNYKNVVDSMHMKVPFGIAQTGKAFRNEITARQFIFRTREFEQMEMQYFVHPDDAMKFYDEWKERRMQFYVDIGINEENLQWHKHENLVFYAKEAYDIEYKYPFGWKELEGIHARGDYDLSQHCEHSGQKLEYVDQVKNEKYTPHVVETSAGVARTMLAVLADAYTEEEVEGDTRVVLKLNTKLAPFKIAVLPLSKKDELVTPARELFKKLSKKYIVDFDITQSIGKRYRRQDEVGTPYCITFDFDSLEDKAVTVRDRDTMKQDRVTIAELEAYFAEKLD
ncbi:glycine--tRNA ligase [Candidatus Uhrbacteria bacterium]|jgi:glycyl-tRNA synthetase|nr:glycine--tRNA ligase [Candidatus Uhrbacteria bacterium]MBT7716936.1 glycine--tRNA ligase [Candidatus Uhrbacteria bacterium]